MKKGLTSLADDLGETVKGINDFIKSLSKAQKDLKEITVEEVQTVSSSSKKIVATAPVQAKTAAASTLFSLLSGSGDAQAAPTTAAPMTAPPSGGPPKAPGIPPSGPPKAPGKASPPSAPPSGPPKAGNLPPAPKLPPSGPPKAPVGPPAAPGAPPQAPAFAKRPAGPPGTPPAGPPKPPGVAPPPAAAAQAGGGLSSLRDEMLDELNRLKKIMRGE